MKGSPGNVVEQVPTSPRHRLTGRVATRHYTGHENEPIAQTEPVVVAPLIQGWLADVC